jgi:HEAT repeats/Cytochrome c554 and c-prime
MLSRGFRRVSSGRTILALLSALAAVSACQRKEPAVLPSRDAYAGSARCAECHEKNHDRWEKDWHARALSPAEARYVAGRFDGTHYHSASSDASMLHRGDAYLVNTAPASGPPRDYPVAWLIGGKRMQDAVTVFPDGRWQVLPVYYHVTGAGEWVDYNEKKQGVVTTDHPFFWTNFRRTANHECLECHATAVDVRYDRASHVWTTGFADAGAACESCHGPGARHAVTKATTDIVRADELDRDRALALCGSCHGPHEPIYPFLDTAHRFRPGDAYEDKLRPLVVVDGLERSGEFFADGRPSSSSFEYQALLQSRCYLKGNATCLTCHTAPHEKKQEHDELKPARNGVSAADATCLRCHAAVFAAGAQHTHHAPAQAGCAACHMPPLVSGVLDRFPDHTLDVPNPRNTAAHGVPNACNVCHERETPQAMTGAMTRWWPQVPARQARRNRLADAIDEKTRSDSKPALIAVLHDAAEAPTLRGVAGILLAQRFPDDAAAAILPHLHDRDPLLRSRLIEALGYARAAASANAIASLLDDPNVKVRERAAVVLSMFHDPRAEPALQRLASDPATTTLVWPHILLGTAAGQHNDLPRAEQEMQRALALTPYLTDALVFLADIDMRRHDRAGARANLEEALRFDPQHRGANGRLRAIEQMGEGEH